MIKEALDSPDKALSKSVEKAIKDGNLVSHALPFTTHTELLDKDLFEYGLSIVDRIDAISGHKTVSAKMPDVPPCFVWRHDGAEIVVIYEGEYGDAFTLPELDKVLYFDHTADNKGARTKRAVLNKLARLRIEFPDCLVRAGSMNDIADELWNIRGRLPVLEGEIGDTWIHGVGTDPYKVGGLRTLCRLRDNWLADGRMNRDSQEYRQFSDALLCIAEHTWGMDMKTHLADTRNYTKKKFVSARMRDRVRTGLPFGDFPFRFLAWKANTFGRKKYSYSIIEKSWAEQREYLNRAVAALSEDKQTEAITALGALRPKTLPAFDKSTAYGYKSRITAGGYSLQINCKGGITLYNDGVEVFNGRELPLFTYRSYGADDYNYFEEHYMRSRVPWAVHDYLRPSLRKDNKYLQGEFDYIATGAWIEDDGSKAVVNMDLACDSGLCDSLGAPRKVRMTYTLDENGLNLRVIWIGKDATRTTESIALHLYPNFDKVYYQKIGSTVDPMTTVSGGNRKLSVVEGINIFLGGNEYLLLNKEAVLVASDGGNILHYDNAQPDFDKHGITYVLHNNVWGTNFPLWYEDNAIFNFVIKKNTDK
ncbi:MAG: DUF5054 domain-containing protein [Clostridia bacterium]|nr:DUF5054 domain-containing protein [Clostridia bacterium]